jgi:hypothetical protein
MAKLILNDWADQETTTLSLLLIHISIEDYQLAYFVNKHAGLSFKAAADLTVHAQHGESKHRVFSAKSSDNSLFLIGNQSYLSNSNAVYADLFHAETTARSFLLKKYSKWDYALLSADIDALLSMEKLFKQHAITVSQPVDLEKLNATEQAALTNFIYENEY